MHFEGRTERDAPEDETGILLKVILLSGKTVGWINQQVYGNMGPTEALGGIEDKANEGKMKLDGI